jgi:hypothetical protein
LALVAVLALTGCSSGGSQRAPASTGGATTTGAISSSLDAVLGQPVTAADGRRFLDGFPGAVDAAPDFDPRIIVDLDRALAKQATEPSVTAIFETVPAARPAGVVAQIYLFCPLAPGAEQCAVTADDYQHFVDGCVQVQGVRVQRLVEQGAGWAAAGGCLSRFTAGRAASVARDAEKRFAASGLKVTAVAELARVAADWAGYRAGQAAPGEFTAVDTAEELALNARLRTPPCRSTRTSPRGAEDNPVPAVGDQAVQDVVTTVGAGASVRLGTGSALGNGRLIVVWCFQQVT